MVVRSPLPASSHIVPDGTATRVAQKHFGGASSSCASSRKPRHFVATAAIDAGVRLNPGWPETGSTSGRESRPVRPPLDVRSVQWIGTNNSPGRWPALTWMR